MKTPYFGRWPPAGDPLRRITKKYGSSIYAAEAYYRIGHLRLERKQYYKAFEAFQVEIARYPNESRFNELIGEEYQFRNHSPDSAYNPHLGRDSRVPQPGARPELSRGGRPQRALQRLRPAGP